MKFKSKTQPLCLWCGQGIKKKTHYFGFDSGSHHNSEYWTVLTVARPQTKADCQRLTNETVVSLQYGPNLKKKLPDGPDGEIRYEQEIRSFTAWDGESYVDQFFCNGTHAQNFAYAVARTGKMAMSAYNDAMRARKEPAR